MQSARLDMRLPAGIHDAIRVGKLIFGQPVLGIGLLLLAMMRAG